MKPIDRFPPGLKCIMCSTNEDDVFLGAIYKFRKTIAHHFCLLLSKEIFQRGHDRQGIMGFLIKDIKEEAKRGEQEVCSYCQKEGATIACAHSGCTIRFHLPCGIKRGSMHLFFDNFVSYCVNHRKHQEIPCEEIEKLKSSKPECPICAEEIELKDKASFIWPSCCKSVPFHRYCLQKYANEAGSYHFKCSLCQDTVNFKKLCTEYGIYIPQRDASWESEPRAFETLHQNHFCNAEVCKCPKGRSFNNSRTKWANIKCTFCHSTGTHLDCAFITRSNRDSWICSNCVGLSERFGHSIEGNANFKKKETRTPLPSTSLIKNSEKIHTGESSSQASPKVVAFNDEVAVNLSDEDPTSPSSFGAQTMEKNFTNTYENSNKTFVVYGMINISSDSDDDVIVKSNVLVVTHPKQKKFLKKRRNVSEAAQPSSIQESGQNNNVPSDQTEKSSSVDEIGRFPLHESNHEKSPDITMHQSKPSASIKPLNFMAAKPGCTSSEPLSKKKKIYVFHVNPPSSSISVDDEVIEIE